jgi:hypothetical protein
MSGGVEQPSAPETDAARQNSAARPVRGTPRSPSSSKLVAFILVASLDVGLTFGVGYTIGLFFVYLTGWCVLVVASYKVVKPAVRDPASAVSPTRSLYLGLVGVGQFFLALIVLGRFWSVPVFGLLFVTQIVGVVLGAFFTGLLGSSRTLAMNQLLWPVTEVMMTSPVLGLLTFVIALSAYAVPIVFGVVYFTHAVPSQQFTVLLFKIWLIYLASVSAVMLGPVVSTMAAPTVTGPRRARWLVASMCGTISVSIYASIAFWAFGSHRSTREFGGISLTVSPGLIGFLGGYLLLATVLPYSVGAFRGRRMRADFLQQRANALAALVETLEVPLSALYFVRLRRLKRSVVREQKRLRDQFALVALEPALDVKNHGAHGDPEAIEEADSVAIEKATRLLKTWFGRRKPIGRHSLKADYVVGAAGSSVPNLRRAYPSMRDEDPRFVQLAWLRGIAVVVDEARQDLQLRRTPTEQSAGAAAWAQMLERRRGELTREIEYSRRLRIPLWLPLGPATAAIGSVFFSQAGKWMWTLASRALPK